ncbi:MAG: hypothetical protein IKL82_00810 [Clostridia bacterium]|nr:hypothetical protein [Clostridia bacterium]
MELFTVKSNNFSLTFNSLGYYVSLTNDSGVNYIEKTPMMALVLNDRTKLYPVSATLNNNLITVNFECTQITVSVNGYNDFLTFTLQSASNHNFLYVDFVNIKSNINYDLLEKDLNAYSLCLMSMTLATRMAEHSGKNEKLIASAYTKIGLFGNDRSPYNAKCAVILCKNKNLSTVQNNVLNLVPNGELIKSTLGGPNAKNARESCQKTYTLHWTPITNDNYEETVSYFKEAGLEQINLHFMEQYSQGTFTVNPKYYKGGLEEYKNIVKRLHQDGFEVGLHCYVFFLSKTDAFVTPVPHDDIDVLNVFTLDCDLSLADTELKTVERLDGVSEKTYYVVNNSNTIRIGNELMLFNGVDSNGRLLNLVRGAYGTKIEEHKKGDKISQYKEYFYHFMAKAGSPLFYQVAKNTAKFYNEVGFDSIYFDALDGASCLEGEDYVWYYAVDFIREFWNNIDHDPVFNCCHNMQYTSTWFGRSRYGALDRPKASYAEYKDAHLLYNKKVARRMGVNEELGWLDLYPYPGENGFYFQHIPVRKEDVSYVYGKAMATGACVTYLECLKDKRELPIIKEHWKTVREYQNYRKTHKLSSDSINYFESQRSYCVIDNGSLKKASYDIYRFEHEDKINYIENEFLAQKPFIRLENLYVADDYEADGVIVGENSVLTNGSEYVFRFNEPVNVESKRGLGVWVKGDGGGGILRVAPRTYAGNSPKAQNYYIKNDFIGWKYFREVEVQTGENKEVPLMEMDNSTYTTLQKFYSYYFGVLDYKEIEALEYSYQGKGTVEVKPSKFVKALEVEIKNPTFTVGNSVITANCTLKAGETLEIEPNGTARVIDAKFNVLSRPTIIGELPTVQSGKTKFTFNAQSNMQYRAKVTIGLIGEELN